MRLAEARDKYEQLKEELREFGIDPDVALFEMQA